MISLSKYYDFITVIKINHRLALIFSRKTYLSNKMAAADITLNYGNISSKLVKNKLKVPDFPKMKSWFYLISNILKYLETRQKHLVIFCVFAVGPESDWASALVLAGPITSGFPQIASPFSGLHSHFHKHSS